MPDTDEPVVFLLPDGTEISDDPRWKAKKFREQIEQQNANLQAQADFSAKEQARLFAEEDASRAEVNAESEEEEDEGDHAESAFSGLTVAELKKEASERDLDLAALGVKKKSELIAALEQHDADQAASSGK